MNKKVLSLVVASLFGTSGAAFAAQTVTENTITENTTYSKTDVTWFKAGANQSIVFSGDEKKSYSLTFDNKQTVTDSFLKAEGSNASILVKNLDVLEFKTTKKMASKPNNNNPILTSSGGSVTFDNINRVQFGTQDAPLQVDQIIHQNWNGGDVTFKNIKTFNAYASRTAFMIQSQPNNFAALNIENVDDVNIVGGNARYGIQIAASATTDLNESYDVLNVKGVKNFNVTGGMSGLVFSDLSGTEYRGYANFRGNIEAENINLTGKLDAGLIAKYHQETQGKLQINLTATKKIQINGVTGLAAQNTQTDKPADNIVVNLNAPKVEVSGSDESYAILNMSTNVNINSDDVTLNGKFAVVLNGSNGASVNFNGSTQDSSVVQANGNIFSQKTNVLGLKDTTLTMADGKNVNAGGEVALENAGVEMNGGYFKAGVVSGENGTLLINDENTAVTVGANEVKGFKVVYSADANDQAGSPEAAMKKAREMIQITDAEDHEGKKLGSHEVSGIAGKIGDSWTITSDGSTVVKTNAALDAVNNFDAMRYVQWRNEGNHIVQRLGDVRDGSTTIGAWARVYGYDSSYSDNVSIDFKANSIQVGGDYRLDNTWLVGGAFSYTDGEGTFSNGSSDSDGYSLAAYLSGFFDCGAYVDVVGRVGRLSTDITASSQTSVFKSSYDNTTLGLSAEVGYHWKVNDTFYVEPQAELTYGFVKGDDFTGENGVKIEQDDFQSLVGRLGARIGASFAEGAGTVYAHASVNHEFLGDVDYTARLGSVSRDLSNEISGTWFSYGVGAQFNTSKNLNFYGTLERSNGSEYDEDYRYSVGMSYRF